MKPILDREILLRYAADYPSAPYPEEPYLDHLEVLRTARVPDDALGQAVRCLFLWKLGKIKSDATATSQPLPYVDRHGRRYHAVGTTGANDAAIERATEPERLRAAIAFREGRMGYDAFREWASAITRGSIVLPAYYVHIWRPAEYPILDVNVWRVCWAWRGLSLRAYAPPGSWADYECYTAFFRRLVEATRLGWRTVDRALWVLGAAGGGVPVDRCRYQ